MSIPLTICREIPTAGAFARRVASSNGGPLRALSIRSVQLNVGLRCNLSCKNCHVQASPRRKEIMSWEIMRLAVSAAKKVRAAFIDITGGEPILHPQIRKLIEAIRAADLQVTLRTNLVILLQDEFRLIPNFLKKHRVRLVGSLPFYEEEQVDQQRGVGVYRDSIKAIRTLNAVGYGIDPTLPLDLVHHPSGLSICGSQAALERDYKRELDVRYGVRFTQLFSVANMPIGKFLKTLQREGKSHAYIDKLHASFNADTLDGLMCRHQLHVAWDGTLYDCDFNCAAGLTVRPDTPNHIRDFDATTYLQRKIAVADHCFGCTAGRGSSWGGAIV